MTKASDEKRKMGREKQNRANIDEEEKVIEDLESQGELKKEVPLGGEEFEDEEPRQGD
jgi:hypothetical protein